MSSVGCIIGRRIGALGLSVGRSAGCVLIHLSSGGLCLSIQYIPVARSVHGKTCRKPNARVSTKAVEFPVVWCGVVVCN